MLSRSKFIKLKEITRYFRIVDELERLRDDLLCGKTPNTEILRQYCLYLQDTNDPSFINEISSVLKETEVRSKIEKAHFLYHKIKEHFGYPVPESKFVKTSKDSKQPRSKITELVIILENLRSAHNVGSIIRSCECFGVKKLIFCGITPGLENYKTLKTSKGAESGVECERFMETAEAVTVLRDDGYSIVCAETGSGSKDMGNYKFVQKTAIVFGNEEIGINSETLKMCDEIVSIEMKGKKNSLNVSNCAAVFMYEYGRKCGKSMTVS